MQHKLVSYFCYWTCKVDSLVCCSTGYLASCWWSSASFHPSALLKSICPGDISFDQISRFFTSVVFSCTCQIITNLQLLFMRWWSLKGDHISSSSKLVFLSVQWCSLEICGLCREGIKRPGESHLSFSGWQPCLECIVSQEQWPLSSHPLISWD